MPDSIGGSYKTINVAKYFEKIGHKPHEKQWLFHNSKARFRLPCCGRRFGKSRMAGVDIQPRLLIPGKRMWAVGPTYDLAEKEFRVVWDDMIVKLGLGSDRRVKRAYNKKQGVMYIEFPWQTRLECRSADHPENLVGDSLDHVIMSEAAKHKKDTFERYIRAALSDHRGTADFPTTPEGQNWFYNMWQMGQDPDDPTHESWRFPSWENPYVFPGGRNDPEILAVERKTTREWFEQEYAADFTAFVGKIFSGFQESVHCRKIRFNPAWANYIAFDWGYTNPMAAVEFQVSPDDRVYVWRMWYKSYMTVPDFLQMIKQTPNPEGYHLDMCFGDAADPAAVIEVSRALAPCLADPRSKSGTNEDDSKGKKASSGWREGVDLINKFLEIRPASSIMDLSDMSTPADQAYAKSLEEPSLFVDVKCKDMIREFNNYRAPDKGRDNLNVREAAQPFDDHSLDALRYGMMHIFKLHVNTHLADIYSEQDLVPTDNIGYSGIPDGGYFQVQNMRF